MQPNPQNPLIIPVPSDRLWFDPMALTVNTSIVMTDVVMGMGTVHQIAPQDSRRYSIGFFGPVPLTSIFVAPWPNVDTLRIGELTNDIPYWFTKLFDHGILVCNEWYGISLSPTTIRRVELIRN